MKPDSIVCRASIFYNLYKITDVAMEDLAESNQDFHVDRLIVSQLPHRLCGQLSRSGQFPFFHPVVPHQIPELVVTDDHSAIPISV